MWTLIAMIGTLIFLLGIVLWKRYRRIAPWAIAVSALALGLSVVLGDPIWVALAALGTLILVWGLSTWRSGKVARWGTLVGAVVALVGLGAGNIFDGSKTLTQTVGNAAKGAAETAGKATEVTKGVVEATRQVTDTAAQTGEQAIANATEAGGSATHVAAEVVENSAQDALNTPADPAANTLSQTNPSAGETTAKSDSLQTLAPQATQTSHLTVQTNAASARVVVYRNGEKVAESLGLASSEFGLEPGQYTVEVWAKGFQSTEVGIKLPGLKRLVLELTPSTL